ncbi:hypothetical protein CcaCcLH18_02767 [Colletotrichum camelliae]|nr:hypothetical protein CcaCcLH18_02767 [Colletotrichum camelliae]
MTRTQSDDDGAGMGSKGLRKSHRKSRGGYSFCKRRRIKCDERKPSCTNCVKRSLWCSLNTSPSPASTPENTVQAKFSEPLPDSQAMERRDGSSFSLDVQDLQLFHHFCSVTSTTFGPTPFVQQFWSITVAQISFSHPFLLRAILAIGGLHMNHLRQNDSETSGWYKTKATAHWQAAVRLATPRLAAIDAESCDPLFIFAMLSCPQTFALGPRSGNFLLFTDDGEMEWPIFFRGLRTVAESSVLFGMTETARPLAFMYGIAKLDLETLPRDELVTSWGRH